MSYRDEQYRKQIYNEIFWYAAEKYILIKILVPFAIIVILAISFWVRSIVTHEQHRERYYEKQQQRIELKRQREHSNALRITDWRGIHQVVLRPKVLF